MSCAAPEKDLLVFLAAGTLAPSEETAALQHASSCPQCKGDLAEAAQLARGVRSLHLTSEEVVDAAWEGKRPPHLDVCPPCDAEVAAVQRSSEELRGAGGPALRLASIRTPDQGWSRLGSALSNAAVAYSGMAASILVALFLGQHLQTLRVENQRLREERRALPQGGTAAALAEAQRERAAAARRSDELQAQVVLLSQPRLNVPIANLEPSGARRGGSPAAPVVEVPEAAGLVTVVLHLEQARQERSYSVEIRDADGRSVWRGGGLLKSAVDTFTLGLPRTLFPAGAYEIRLSAEEGPRSTLVETYALRLQHR
jgi:hypothetical protein